MVTSRGFDASALLKDRAQDRTLSLRAALAAVGEIPEPLQGRMAGGLRNEITRAVAVLEEDLLDPLARGTLHPGDAWARMHATDWTVQALLSEALLLLGGAVVRSPGTSDGTWRSHVSQFCTYADTVVDEIASRTPVGRWESFTVPGLVDQFRYETRLISVPFARPSLWSLPTAAHEFGHHAARSIHRFEAGRSRNLLDELHAALPETASWYWVEELFADAFAAWTMGPAYGLTCLTLTFDPVTAGRGTPTHPPDSTRLALVCDVLARFEDQTVVWLSQSMAQAWRRLVEVSEAGEGRDEARAAEWFADIAGLLRERLPFATYATAGRAAALAADGLRGDAATFQGSAVDVVNAAWMARVDAPSLVSVSEIHSNALDHLQHVMNRG